MLFRSVLLTGLVDTLVANSRVFNGACALVTSGFKKTKVTASA